MAGLFDQYEQPAEHLKHNNSWNPSGFIHMKMEPEIPIFSKTKMNFVPSNKITHVAISNKYLVVAMSNGILFRMNLQQPDRQDEIMLTKYTASGNKLANLFLDPTGNHLLLTFTPTNKTAPAADCLPDELVYLSRKVSKLKPASKFKGHKVTEIGWNYLNESESCTGPILLGTSKGLIFETEIASDGEKFFTSGFSSGLEQYWRQVFDIGKGVPTATASATATTITGLEFFKGPGSEKYCIFVATPTRLYYFNGRVNPEEKPLLQQVFNKYLNIPETQTFEEVKSNLHYSRLKFWSENSIHPNAFVWMVEDGMKFARSDSSFVRYENLKSMEPKHIAYPKPLYEDYSVSQKPPFSCVLTEFHALLAYADTIKGICLLNDEVVYEDNYNEAFGRLVDIVKDRTTGVIWAVSENAVFRFKVTKEERNVWQIYCDNGRFDLAKKYSQQNPVYYNQILCKEADMLFDKKEYLLSAERYAETRSGFEQVCLKFIQVAVKEEEEENRDALKAFLRKKLQVLAPQDKTQTTLTVIWVTELYMSQLEAMRIDGKEQTSKYFELQKEFQAFLALPPVAECIRNNKSTIYDLMASHGDKSNLIQQTIVNKDLERLVRHHLYKNSFHEALEVLKSQENKDLFYQYAPILMQEIPKYTVKALIDQSYHLRPSRLLPALVSCSGEFHSKQVIVYLEHCIKKLGCTDQAIHNLLLSLYVKHSPEQLLLTYLEDQGQELLLVNYNVHFALRLCQERNLTQACVQLSALLGLWESAVDLALTIDVDLAKRYANMAMSCDDGDATDDDATELKKKLWLKIAQHVVCGKNNIQQAMDFLQQCDLLRIEDILPFFSDFVTIDHFKDAICDSLNEYNKHIQDLKEDMENATKSAEQVRKEIQSFRNRYTFVQSGDACEICSSILMTRPFYFFPCGHKFHGDCLTRELCPMLGPAKRNKLEDLKKQLQAFNSQTGGGGGDNLSTGSTGLSGRYAIKADIDNIIASECLYCGENMIKNIDHSFIEENEFDEIVREWE